MKLIKSLCLATIVSACLAHFGFAADKRWKNVTEGSFVSANGNSKSSAASGKNTYNYDWTKVGLELIAGGMGSSNNGVTTAEKYNASEKVNYKLTERNYTFEKGSWEKNRFAGFHNRWDGQLGLGRELIKTQRQELLGELGGGYISEERVNAETNQFTSGRAYSKYTLAISSTSTFSQDVEYLHNFENADDFRVNTETSLTALISTHFSLKVSYKWQYVGEPPLGFGRNDTTTTVGLVATY